MSSFGQEMELFFPVKFFQIYFQYFYKLSDNLNFGLFEQAYQKNLGAKRAKAPDPQVICVTLRAFDLEHYRTSSKVGLLYYLLYDRFVTSFLMSVNLSFSRSADSS